MILEVQGGLPRAEGLTATPRAGWLTAHPLVHGPVLSVPAPVPAQRRVGVTAVTLFVSENLAMTLEQNLYGTLQPTTGIWYLVFRKIF